MFDHPITAVMLLFITGIGSLIVMYSSRLHGHGSWFSTLSCLFELVPGINDCPGAGGFTASDVPCWEGVGVCSYLLIGFWHKSDENNAAANKAFIVNRVGDLGVPIGLFALIALVAGRPK